MKRYNANKKGYYIYLMIGMLLLPAVFLFAYGTFWEDAPGIAISFLPFLLLAWIYFDTYYIIDENILKYRAGFIRGKIDIKKINQITVGKTLWSGIKPALATKGLIIKYNRYSEIYIAPVSNEEMVNDLLKINPEIKIIH